MRQLILSARRMALGLGLAMAATLPAAAHEFELGSIQIIHPSVPATPPNATAAPLYMALANNDHHADRLLSVETPYGPVRFRRPVPQDDGSLRFEDMEWIDIPAETIVILASGTVHGVIDGVPPLTQGQEIPVKMTFETRGTTEMHLQVDPVAPLDGADGAVASPSHQAGDVLQIGAALRTALAPQNATVMPIVMNGDFAIAGWTTDDVSENGAARALLRREGGQWGVQMFADDSLLQPATLVSAGLSDTDAQQLISDVATYEAMIAPETVARFNAFPGTRPVAITSEETK
ncbi:copper uptake system-associated protein [Ketogulonicigenium robustum]|nr:copper uptake system-associated protein [Ketogulonicigenium robustum]